MEVPERMQRSSCICAYVCVIVSSLEGAAAKEGGGLGDGSAYSAASVFCLCQNVYIVIVFTFVKWSC